MRIIRLNLKFAVVLTAVLSFLSASVRVSARPIVFRTSFSGGDIPSIDPSLVEEPYGIQLVDELTVGLLRMNEETLVLDPGIAERYEINETGDSVTFYLRTDVPWVRYDSERGAVERVVDCRGAARFVTAADFVYGIERTLRPETAAPFAFLLNKVVAGAAAYNDGSNPDFGAVGIRAIDERTLTVDLVSASPYTLNILSLWMFRAEPGWLIEGDDCTEAYGDRWAETDAFQGYGPFTLKSWTHDAELTLIRNPFWPASEAIPSARIDEVTMLMISETSAIAEYEAGNLDYAIVGYSDYDRLESDPCYADALVGKPLNVGTEAVLFNHLLPPTDDVRVRRALSLAIDRAAVAAALKSGTPARYWIHPSAIGAPDPGTADEFGAETDISRAKALIDDYCAEKGIEPGELTLTYYYSSSDLHQIRGQVLAEMWRGALGINVVLENSDWGVFKDVRKEGRHHIYRTAWNQDYLDANNFTADVFLCPGGYYQPSTDWPTEGCAEPLDADPLYTAYAELLDSAASERDPARRAELYARSEKILIREAAILSPISYNDATYLLNPIFQVPTTRTGYDRWEKWGVVPEREPFTED